MKKHIIFDVDDTLTNSYSVNQQLFLDTFLNHLPNIDQEIVREIHYAKRGVGMEQVFQEVINLLKLDLNAKDLVVENENMHIASFEKFNSMTLFANTPEFLALIKEKGKLLSVCTNRQYGSLKKIFDNNDITKYFDNIISCKDEGHEKPDPYCLEEMIKKYDEPKSSYIYIGDSKTDRDFAKAAGIDYLIIDNYLNEQNFYRNIIFSFIQ